MAEYVIECNHRGFKNATSVTSDRRARRGNERMANEEEKGGDGVLLWSVRESARLYQGSPSFNANTSVHKYGRVNAVPRRRRGRILLGTRRVDSLARSKLVNARVRTHGHARDLGRTEENGGERRRRWRRRRREKMVSGF